MLGQAWMVLVKWSNPSTLPSFKRSTYLWSVVPNRLSPIVKLSWGTNINTEERHTLIYTYLFLIIHFFFSPDINKLKPLTISECIAALIEASLMKWHSNVLNHKCDVTFPVELVRAMASKNITVRCWLDIKEIPNSFLSCYVFLFTLRMCFWAC